MPSFSFNHPGLANVRMNFAEEGAGNPPIVLIHGYGCAHADWAHQVSSLSTNYRTIAVDLPGHGASTHRVPGCRVEHLGDHVGALIENAGLEKAIVVGHSMGCRVAMQAASYAPSRVAGVVLVDGSWIGQGDGAALEADARSVFEQGGFHPTVARLFADMFLDASPNERASDIIERAGTLDPDLGTGLFGSLVRWDAERLTAALTALKCAVTLVQSTYLNADRKRVALTPGDTTPWLDLVRQRRPEAHIELVYDVGHFTMIEAPETVANVIREAAKAPA